MIAPVLMMLVVKRMVELPLKVRAPMVIGEALLSLKRELTRVRAPVPTEEAVNVPFPTVVPPV